MDDNLIDIRDKKSLRLQQKKMGMIFQSFNLLERLDVYQNVALPMKFWGIPTNTPAAKDKIIAVLIVISFAASYAFTMLPVFAGISGGTKTIILTVVISAGAALFVPHKEDDE